MSFKVKGKLIALLPLQSGTSTRGEWKKQDFVIETMEEQFARKICFTLFNDKIDLLNGIAQNSDVEVSFSIEGREYQGRWYHNINAFRIDAVSNQAPQTGGLSDFPGNMPPPPDTVPPLADEKDDLPF